MLTLISEQCIACRGDSPLANRGEIKEMLPEIPNWSLIKEKGTQKLTRIFPFRKFKQALEFTQDIGLLAEHQGHHPRLITEWGSVTVLWWTHKIKGLHRNDFIMAAKTDYVYHHMVIGSDQTI